MSAAAEDGRRDVAPLPEGARDVLPVEWEELTTIENALRGAFGRFGYREVRTPLLEYADVMDRAQEGGIGRAFRLFDDHGEVLVVRPDLTIPVARLVAGRLAGHPGPVRVTYVGERVRPAPVGKAQRVEERQAGLELVGMPGAAADAEIIGVIVGALRGLGVGDLRVGLGDVALTQAVLVGVGVSEPDQARLQEAVRTRNLVAWRRIADSLDLGDDARALVGGLPTRRGGVEVLQELAGAVPSSAAACVGLASVLDVLGAHEVVDAVMIDFGVFRDWTYYSGIVFEAYAPGLGRPVAVGGRYDELIGRFGAPRPAVGAAVFLDRLHEALAARNGDGILRDGIVMVGGLGGSVAEARSLRAVGATVIGIDGGPSEADALAETEGWRYTAWPGEGGGFTLTDRQDGAAVTTTNLAEAWQTRRS